MPRHRVNLALAATLIAEGQTLTEVAPKVNSASAKSLQILLSRNNVTVKKVKQAVVNRIAPEANANLIIRVASQASAVLRDRHAKLLAKATDQLEQVSIEPNPQSIKAFGEAAEPVVRMAKTVHGWSDDDSGGGLLALSRSVSEDDPALTCGVSATISSVPLNITDSPTPQAAQASDPEPEAT